MNNDDMKVRCIELAIESSEGKDIEDILHRAAAFRDFVNDREHYVAIAEAAPVWDERPVRS